jgi:hypothetical protein
MKEVIASLQSEYDAALDEIDISGDADLERTFGEEIPVLFINDRKAFKYRVTATELRQRLAREGRGRRWW